MAKTDRVLMSLIGFGLAACAFVIAVSVIRTAVSEAAWLGAAFVMWFDGLLAYCGAIFFLTGVGVLKT